MDKEIALEILQFQFHLQFAQVDTKAMETETVLSHLNQSFVTLDLLAMDQEVASQLLYQPLQHAQVDISPMDKEIVFQTLYLKLLALVDSPLMEKETASGFPIHQFLLLQLAHLVSSLMDLETVSPLVFQLFVDQDILVMEMETVFKKLQVSLHHKFAQAELTVMEMEIVFQIQLQYLVLMDGNLMDKVDAFH
jgi:hypothetical protein